MNLNNLNIKVDNTWTLFLDRDGVINKKIDNDYIKNWNNFEFINGVLEALNYLSNIFGEIFIVSNQQGIGKGLMTEDDLNIIHFKMIEKIKKNGGRIDKIYYCPYKEEENNILRKPDIGMALQAKKDFPDINLKKFVMVGDSVSDMQFGRKAKMKTILISSDLDIINKNQDIIDYYFKSLYEFSQRLKK